MEDVEQPQEEQESVFDDFAGFSEPNGKNHFPMPQEWSIISTFIDNLAEYKVVEYILRRTWGYHEHDAEKHITLEEFMHGRTRKDGSKVDYGTGLSKPSVVAGIKRAMKHHLICCTVDASDKGNIKKYYSINFYKTTEKRETDPVKDLYRGVKDLNSAHAQQRKDLYTDQSNKPLEETSEEILRIDEREETEQQPDNIRYIHPQNNDLDEEKHVAPRFIVQVITDFSRDFGDYENTRSNITRATKMYRASQHDPDTFLDLIYQARDKTRKATVRKINSQGRPNRMPYFFKCLEQLVKQPIAMEG